MIITHEQIANRARQIWEKAGRPEGRDKEHWLQAESELRQESNRRPGTPPAISSDAALMKVPGEVGTSTDLKNGSESRKRSARRPR